MNLLKRKPESAGFTLIELVIVAAMTAMIAAVTLANYRAGEKAKRVSLAGDGIMNALTLAQTYALSGKSTNNSQASCRAPQYYYVAFTYTSSYSLAAMNNCGTVDTIETYPLPTNVRVKASGLKLDGTAAASLMNIAIYPPYGQIKAISVSGGTYAAFGSATIQVESTDGTKNQIITVDGLTGRIGQ